MDGAPAHKKSRTKNWLVEHFGDRMSGDRLWPPRSPDLSVCDYYLRSRLKAKVYDTSSQSVDELKVNNEKKFDRRLLQSYKLFS